MRGFVASLGLRRSPSSSRSTKGISVASSLAFGRACVVVGDESCGEVVVGSDVVVDDLKSRNVASEV